MEKLKANTMKIIRFFLYILTGMLILAGGSLGYFTLTEFDPPVYEVLYQPEDPDTIPVDTCLGVLLWNIGYAGLGDDMDFFYDGGKQVRTSEERMEENLGFVSGFLHDNDSIPFFLIQEVDRYSKRTYRKDEFSFLEKVLGRQAYFALNYKVKFVPLPPSAPMGRVESGLATFSRFTPVLVERFNFPGDFSWPTDIFMLDRGFMVCRYPVSDGKELLLINSHNSAFDDGSLKRQEMEYLRSFLLGEYQKGNYILVGADWNQNPPGFAEDTFGNPPGTGNFILSQIDANFTPPGWEFVYDPSRPTNRDLSTPYNPEVSFTTILDFFLVSPNVEAMSIACRDLGFRHSDHQPVFGSFRLKSEP